MCPRRGEEDTVLLVCISLSLWLFTQTHQSQALTRASSTWNSQHFLGPSAAGVSGTPPPSSPPLRALRSQKQRLAGGRLGFCSVSRLEDSRSSHPRALGPDPRCCFPSAPAQLGRSCQQGCAASWCWISAEGWGWGAPPRKRPVRRRSWNLATWPHLRSPLPCPPRQGILLFFFYLCTFVPERMVNKKGLCC